MTPTIPKPAALYRNIVSHVGVLVMTGAGTLILFAMLSQLTIEHQSPYVGIFTYMIFPAFFSVGLVLFLWGMRWESKRRRRSGSTDALPYPKVDLNLPSHRRRFGIALVSGSVAGVLLVWAIYNGYLFTESVTFCGQVCHTPMQPEFTAYSESPHARVPCVDCHVGEGASWYVRSKLSGARQVLAVLFNSYTRPIGVPIKHLRPARETCERCHWPEKFNGAKYVQIPYYRYDEQNTSEQLSFTVKTGGGTRGQGGSAGIHWHMVIDNVVTYVATDEKRQVIPWVKVRRTDGTTTIYRSRLKPISDAKAATLENRVMDCMDCHNRPTHNYPNPDSGVDESINRGLISRDLPWIKKLSVEALTRTYANNEMAHRGIGDYITGFYQREKPEVLASKRGAIDRAITTVSRLYDRGVFPAMHVNWRTYAVNLGHFQWPGCFRCHDGDHVSSDGKVLSHDCGATCHTLPQRGPITPLGEPSATVGIQPIGESADVFASWHPWQLPEKHLSIEAHRKALCDNCHASGQRPARVCGDCH